MHTCMTKLYTVHTVLVMFLSSLSLFHHPLFSCVYNEYPLLEDQCVAKYPPYVEYDASCFPLM